MAVRILIVGCGSVGMASIVSRLIQGEIIIASPTGSYSCLDKKNIDLLKEEFQERILPIDFAKESETIKPYWQRQHRDVTYTKVNHIRTKGERYLVNKRGTYYK